MVRMLRVFGAVIVAASGASALGQVEIGGRVFVSSTDEVVATYLGTTAGVDHDLYLASPPNSLGIIFSNHIDPVGTMRNLGSFPVGTELIFRMHVNNTSEDYFSGPGMDNPDGLPH